VHYQTRIEIQHFQFSNVPQSEWLHRTSMHRVRRSSDSWHSDCSLSYSLPPGTAISLNPTNSCLKKKKHLYKDFSIQTILCTVTACTNLIKQITFCRETGIVVITDLFIFLHGYVWFLKPSSLLLCAAADLF